MSNHTPGPWTAYAEEVFADAGGYIAKVGDGVDIDVDDANANLIAAAPGLLEALEYMVSEIVVTTDGAHGAYETALAAIAKARGTTQ